MSPLIRKLYCLPFAILAIMLAAGSALGQTTHHTQNLGGGTLSYFVYHYTDTCQVGGFHFPIDHWNFSSFSYASSIAENIGIPGTTNFTHNKCTGANTRGPNVTYNGGGYSITITPQSGGSVTATMTGVSGYINPKYVVVGVIYAPPGSKSSVNYTNSSTVSNTSSISATFKIGVTESTSTTTPGGIFGFLGGSETTTSSTSWSQEVQNSYEITVGKTTSLGMTVPGPANDYVGVDHDYDIIKVWVNPVMLFTNSADGSVFWKGYGLSTLDPVGVVDIVDVYAGCLNGDFAPSDSACSQATSSFQRAWAANENWPSGQGPALTQTDLNDILAADVYGQCKPSSPAGSSVACPAPSNQFTLTAPQDIPYLQPPPGGQPTTTTATVSYTNSSTVGLQFTTSFSQTYGVEDAFTGTDFLSGFAAKVSQSQTLTWTFVQNNKISSSSTSTATATITGPACNGNPCNPSYPPNPLTYGTALYFDLYQDNFFGTFLVVPAVY